MRLVCLGIALLVCGCLSQLPNEVTQLPGWKDKLPSRQFSGFLNITGTQRRLHYILVESESEPTTDPLVFWFNGGPGCSSLIGYFTEQGPFRVENDLTLKLNPHRWNILANMVFLEAPAGVGYSYEVGRTPGYTYVTNDTQTASDNYNAVVAFLETYPQYKQRDLYLTGESYAGIYVPLLAQQIHAHNQQGANINMKGIAVGNGALATGTWYEDGLVKQRMEFFYEHGLFSTALYDQILAACGTFASPRSPTCVGLLATMVTQVGPLSTYDIRVTCTQQETERLSVFGADPLGPMIGEVSCLDTANAIAYLNQKTVVAALYVQDAIAALGTWTDCASDVNYTRIPMDETKTVYPDLIGNYRVLIYNGDQDTCIPYTQDEAWTRAYGVAVVKDWHPWMVNSQVAGYATSFDKNFTFTTVKGAGHMVPEFQPARALGMFRRFISGTPF